MCNEDYVKCNAQHGRCTNPDFCSCDGGRYYGQTSINGAKARQVQISRAKMRMREREVGWRGVRVADV